jgi:hypothetical protein
MVREKGMLELTDLGFVRLYEKLLPLTESYMEAYQAAEEVHEQIYGGRRYSDYNSFRQVINRAIKKN